MLHIEVSNSIVASQQQGFTVERVVVNRIDVPRTCEKRVLAAFHRSIRIQLARGDVHYLAERNLRPAYARQMALEQLAGVLQILLGVGLGGGDGLEGFVEDGDNAALLREGRQRDRVALDELLGDPLVANSAGHGPSALLQKIRPSEVVIQKLGIQRRCRAQDDVLARPESNTIGQPARDA